MRALMGTEVNQLGGLANCAEGGFGDSLRRADDGQHGAVMVGVALAVEELHLRHGGDLRDNLIQHIRAASLREIWYTFDKLSHEGSFFPDI